MKSVRGASAGLLALYAVLVARLTLEPAGNETPVFERLNRYAAALSGQRLDWSDTEMLANIGLFIPVGFLLAMVLRQVGLSAALCVAGSVLIELGQYRFLPSRVPTIDDVWHNGIGGAIGAAMTGPVNLWLRRRGESAVESGSNAMIGPGGD
ncbi:MAG: VanZ family protein [Pseudonocardiales bacterium]|nr:VanZ family protein [Pseudonocardiales bacterium]